MTQPSALSEPKREQAQMVYNAQVQAINMGAIAADELWSFIEKITLAKLGYTSSLTAW